MTSAGTIPSGLHLYWFTYPYVAQWDHNRCECEGRDMMFLEGDAEAILYAEQHGAIKAEHVLSGEIVYQAEQ